MLRRPTPDDADAVSGLLDELGHPGQVGVAERIAAWNADPDAELAVAADGTGALVGLVAVTAQRTFHQPAPLAVVVSLVVSSRARGAGVGRELVDAAEEFARARGCSAIQLSSNRTRPEAHAFYRRLGFADRCATHARYVRPVPYG